MGSRLLIDEAKKNAVPASDTLIVENLCAYAMAGQGGVSMHERSHRASGMMPSPAKFRKQLAAVNLFDRQGRLLFDDELWNPVFPAQVNGIVLHSPIGSKFEEEHQSLGSIGFYIPYEDFSNGLWN